MLTFKREKIVFASLTFPYIFHNYVCFFSNTEKFIFILLALQVSLQFVINVKTGQEEMAPRPLHNPTIYNRIEFLILKFLSLGMAVTKF